MVEELASIHELHDHVQVICVLERILQLHNEGVLDAFKYLSFG